LSFLLEVYRSTWFEYGFGNDSKGGVRCHVVMYVFGFTVGGCNVNRGPMLLFVARCVMVVVFLLLRGGPCCLRGEI
jgi:hypothetical protein